jgi:bifunctional DNA-binding transcriptional regulator/antitoxin component of YhaV-PrlF toxin-antitoxin module
VAYITHSKEAAMERRAEVEATVTSKGQITIPREAVGDRIEFEKLEDGAYRIRARKRRSYLAFAAGHPLPKRARPFWNERIDEAVGEAMTANWDRTKARKASSRSAYRTGTARPTFQTISSRASTRSLAATR